MTRMIRQLRRRPPDSMLKSWLANRLRKRRPERRLSIKRRPPPRIKRSRMIWLGDAKRRKRTERGKRPRLPDRGKPKSKRLKRNNKNNRPPNQLTSSERMRTPDEEDRLRSSGTKKRIMTIIFSSK